MGGSGSSFAGGAGGAITGDGFCAGAGVVAFVGAGAFAAFAGAFGLPRTGFVACAAGAAFVVEGAGGFALPCVGAIRSSDPAPCAAAGTGATDSAPARSATAIVSSDEQAPAARIFLSFREKSGRAICIATVDAGVESLEGA
jgi:hypothetical protein